MVTLNRIYTRTGDGGLTRLATGAPRPKHDPRVEAYGGVDETNACIGVARTHTVSDTILDPILARVQNDLFDLGADLATPGQMDGALRILPGQVDRLEREIDQLNAELSPLTSFILPGGGSAAAALHVARTVCRRAERGVTLLMSIEGGGEPTGEGVSADALKYLNRLSDLLFVAARWTNDRGRADVLWTPGGTR